MGELRNGRQSANGRPSAEDGWECIGGWDPERGHWEVGDVSPSTTAGPQVVKSHGPELNAPPQNDKLDAPPQNDGGPESAPLHQRGVPRADPVYHCEACNTWITGPNFQPEPNIEGPLCPVCRKKDPLFVTELRVRPFTDKVKNEYHEIYF